MYVITNTLMDTMLIANVINNLIKYIADDKKNNGCNIFLVVVISLLTLKKGSRLVQTICKIIILEIMWIAHYQICDQILRNFLGQWNQITPDIRSSSNFFLWDYLNKIKNKALHYFKICHRKRSLMRLACVLRVN